MYGSCDKVGNLIMSFICLELYGTGKPVPSVDWWSLGAILYETLTGLVRTALDPMNVLIMYYTKQ